MKIMVVGGGGREHAIIKKIKENDRVSEIFALPGNGGIARDATCVNIGGEELIGIVDFAEEEAIDFAVVAPDDPLVMGLVDLLEDKGIPCFGPNKSAAIIEGSKSFSKELMRKYGIPTAQYEIFTDKDSAIQYLETCNIPVVIKADGLAKGKGVIIAETRETAETAVTSMMEDKIFGESGSCIVIEEFLEGPEVSVLSFTDGKVLIPMISSMGHKRALDGDKGLNTGGMGTIAPNPYYTEDIAAQCEEEIFLPTMVAMNKEGNFQLDESGTYGIWLSGKMFTKAPIGEFGFAIVNEQTGKRISIMPSIMRTRVNGFTNSRIELYTFSANAGSYTLSLTNDPSLLDTVSGALGKVVSKKAVDYTQFSIQIYKNKPTILLFLCTWLIILGFFSFVGGIILAVLTGTKI